MYDLFLPGDYFFDLIYTGLPEFPMLGREVYSTGIIATGGAMYITAVAAKRLGVRAAWAGCFGSDYYSQYVRELAEAEGVDLSLARSVDQSYRRVTTSIPYQGERAFVTYVDPEPIDLLAFWLEKMRAAEFRHLHLGALMSVEQLAPLAEEARAHNATISMDCQDVPDLQSVCMWRDLLGQIDIFIPNAREAMAISGSSAVKSALEQLMEWTRIVVVKDGANGAWLGTDGKITHVPAINIGPAIDTTGAGDCFNAGFLYGFVCEQAPLALCAHYGNICGGFSVTHVGGATAAPTLEQLRLWVGRD